MTEGTTWMIRTQEEQDQILNEFKERCQGADRNEPVSNASGLFCPTLWDNVTCWHATRAGEMVVQPCPGYVVGVNPEGHASKQCMQDGRWYVSPRWQRHWTNLTDCFHGRTASILSSFDGTPNVSYIEEYIPAVKTIYRVGFSLSLVTLIIALVILATNKRLRCPRNVVHMHLFVSFVLRAFFVLLKDSTYVNGVGLSFNVVENDTVFVSNSICKFVTSMWQYSRLANYSWILMEGLYLHNLIFLALFSDTSSITLYIILGWGLPVLFLLPWVGLRIGLNNHLCWNTNETMPFISFIIEVPITVSVLINTIFFLNIVRVLLHKIKATFVEKPQTYRKWAKSTLVLVPLFGVHYILFLGMNWIPENHRNASAEIVWLFCDQFFSSFQGLVVAILYCFLNGEVKSELNKKWQSIRRKNASGRKLSAFTKTSSVHGTYCTTASSASLNSLKWGNSRVGQPAQCTNDKKLSPFYPQLTETTRLNNYGNFNAGNCEENDWSRPSEHTANAELGCLIP